MDKPKKDSEEMIALADQIKSKIKSLEAMRSELRERAERKANAISGYDRILTSVIMKLNNGKEMTHDDESVKDPAKSILIQIAKGICHAERLELELADAMYKALISNIEVVKAQLNGLQSINKHLNEN